MCTRITCADCGKPGYTGCGAHVEQVLRGVPPEQRCRCREERADKQKAQPSWRERLFGAR
jgi:hypothetical protein